MSKIYLGGEGIEERIDALTDCYENFRDHPFWNQVRTQLLKLRRDWKDRCSDETLSDVETHKLRGAVWALTQILDWPEKLYEELLKDLEDERAKHDEAERAEREGFDSAGESTDPLSYPDPDDD